MSDAKSAILEFLGLTQTVKSVQNAVTASKKGVALINAWNELAATPDGKKFLKTAGALIAGSSVDDKGRLHIDEAPADPEPQKPPQVARGRWEYDGFSATGWVWVPEE